MDGGFYAAAIRDAEYETVLQLALSALEFSDCAIINAPFGWQLAHPDYFEKLKRALSEKRIRLVFVWVQADEQTCRKRMEERAAERDRKKIRDWESYRRSLRFAPPAFLAEEKLVDCFFMIDNRDEPSCEASVAAIAPESIQRLAGAERVRLPLRSVRVGRRRPGAAGELPLRHGRQEDVLAENRHAAQAADDALRVSGVALVR